jgi:hypothetical protein
LGAFTEIALIARIEPALKCSFIQPRNRARYFAHGSIADAFQEFVVTANEASYEEISNLTPEEHRAYQRVRAGKLLLEQEKIPHA